jgi:hypothetical protein
MRPSPSTPVASEGAAATPVVASPTRRGCFPTARQGIEFTCRTALWSHAGPVMATSALTEPGGDIPTYELRTACAVHSVRRPARSLASGLVQRLEEIACDAGRDTLADYEALVAGVRQRTGTRLAAHALVASFLGATTIRETGLDPWRWVALAALVLGLVAEAVLLAPWELKFSVDGDRPTTSSTSSRHARRMPARSGGLLRRATVEMLRAGYPGRRRRYLHA